MRATGFNQLLSCIIIRQVYILGHGSFTSFVTILPDDSFTSTRPPMPKSRSHQVLFGAPAYGATPSWTYPALLGTFEIGFSLAHRESMCPASIATPFPGS